MSRGLKNPIRSMFTSSVRGVVSDYNREHRLLDRIRHLEAQIHTYKVSDKHLQGVIKAQTELLLKLEEYSIGVGNRIEALEKILVKQNS